MGSNILGIVQSVFNVFHRFKCYSKDEKLLYNVRETAAVLGVNVHLVYELINRKLLPALRLGSLKVRKSTLIDFVERYEGMDLSGLDNIKELQQNMN